MTIGVWMLYGVGDVFDSEVGVKFSELLMYKLSAIVGYDSVRHPVAAYDIFLDELLDLLRYDNSQWFSFYPLGKVVNAYNEEFYNQGCPFPISQKVMERIWSIIVLTSNG